MKTYGFYEEAFGFTLHLLWDLDGPQLASYIRTTFPEIEVDKEDESDNWEGRHTMLEFERGGIGYEVHVVALRSFSLSPGDISILTHELLHATHEALSTRGIKLCEETKEVYCYLHDSLVRRCLSGLMPVSDSHAAPAVSS